jgi:hypothetical protein
MSTSDLILSALSSGTPVILWGPPGVGKTAVAQEIARQTGRHLETVIASVREPSDFAGLPVVTAEGVVLEPPSWAKRLVAKTPGILFLDEVSTAAPAVQAALLRVIHDRVIGDLALPPDTWILGAANPTSCAAGGWDLAAPTSNRFLHLEFALDPMAWSESFPGYWGTPPVVPSLDLLAWFVSRAEVAGYIHAHPSALMADLDKLSESAAGGAWPSPRSWDAASRALAACGGWQSPHALVLVSGCVGRPAALEFFQWRRSADLPDPEAVIRGQASVPQRSDAAYCTLAAVAQCVQSDLTPARYSRAWDLMAEQAEAGRGSIAAVAVSSLAKLRASAVGRSAGLDGIPSIQQARPFASLLADAGILRGAQ